MGLKKVTLASSFQWLNSRDSGSLGGKEVLSFQRHSIYCNSAVLA